MSELRFNASRGFQSGALTIDGTTGDITTSGNVTVTGSGSINVTNLGVSQISKNDSSITINDTGTGSSIVTAIDGSTLQTVSSAGVNLASGAYQIGGSTVLNATTLGSGVTASSLTSVGTLTGLTTSGSILPTVNGTQDIGSAAMRWRRIYVNEAMLSVNTLYLGDTPVMGTNMNTIEIKADPDQSMLIKTQGTGTTQIQSASNVHMYTSAAAADILIQTSGTGALTRLQSASEIDLTAPTVKTVGNGDVTGNLSVAGSITITGNLTVNGARSTVNSTTVTTADNIIVTNYGEVGSGVTAGLAGIQVDRGDQSDYQIVFDEVDDMFKVGMVGNLQIIASQNYVQSYAAPISHVSAGVTAGTYRSVTVDAKGHVTAGSNPTTIAGYGLTDAQPLDADLTALAGLATYGMMARTGDGVYTMRTVSQGTGVTVTNGDGVSGNPTISIGQSVATTANVTFGNVATTNISGTLTTASQTNITSVGSLGSLTVIGLGQFGNVSATNLTGTVATAAQPNITSVGTLTSLAVTGNLSAANIAGTITTAAQPNITSVGTLGNLTVTNTINGNINGSAYNVTGAAQPNITSVGTLSGLTVTATITGNISGSAGTAGTVTTAAQPTITSVGTLTGLTVSGATSITNNTASTSTSTGALVVTGGVGIGGNLFVGGSSGVKAGNITVSADTISSTASTITIDPATAGVGGTVIIAGNLQVTGTTTTVDSTTVSTADLQIDLASTAANAAAANGAGLNIVGANATFTYTSADDRWNMNKNLNVGTVYGALSGNATSATTASSCSGNSATATTATNANNVNLVDAANVAAAHYLVFADAATGNQALQTDGGITYNPSTNVLTTTASAAQYADLAENYAADQAIEAGTVVDFGGEFEVTVSTVDGSRKVAGVVSTAPAYLMNEKLDAEFVVALALQGRVPVKVTGKIEKGDMLVSAGSGRARAEADPKLGQVIGKALESFDGAEGVIEVVVGRM